MVVRGVFARRDRWPLPGGGFAPSTCEELVDNGFFASEASRVTRENGSFPVQGSRTQRTCNTIVRHIRGGERRTSENFVRLFKAITSRQLQRLLFALRGKASSSERAKGRERVCPAPTKLTLALVEVFEKFSNNTVSLLLELRC